MKVDRLASDLIGTCISTLICRSYPDLGIYHKPGNLFLECCSDL